MPIPTSSTWVPSAELRIFPRRTTVEYEISEAVTQVFPSGERTIEYVEEQRRSYLSDDEIIHPETAYFFEPFGPVTEIPPEKSIFHKRVPATDFEAQPITLKTGSDESYMAEDAIVLQRLRCYDPRPGRFLDRAPDPARLP